MKSFFLLEGIIVFDRYNPYRLPAGREYRPAFEFEFSEGKISGRIEFPQKKEIIPGERGEAKVYFLNYSALYRMDLLQKKIKFSDGRSNTGNFQIVRIVGESDYAVPPHPVLA